VRLPYIHASFLACSLVQVDQRFTGAYCLLHQDDDSLPWKWRQNRPLKRRITSTRLHVSISQKAFIFILAAVRIWNLTVCSFLKWLCIKRWTAGWGRSKLKAVHIYTARCLLLSPHKWVGGYFFLYVSSPDRCGEFSKGTGKKRQQLVLATDFRKHNSGKVNKHWLIFRPNCRQGNCWFRSHSILLKGEGQYNSLRLSFSNWVPWNSGVPRRSLRGSAKYWWKLECFVSFCSYIYRLYIITLNSEYKVIFKTSWLNLEREWYFVKKLVNNFRTFELYIFFILAILRKGWGSGKYLSLKKCPSGGNVCKALL
jgi:hypothetical protein